MHSESRQVASSILKQDPFNGFFSATTRVRCYQKHKAILNFYEAKDDGVLSQQQVSKNINKAPLVCH